MSLLIFRQGENYFLREVTKKKVKTVQKFKNRNDAEKHRNALELSKKLQTQEIEVLHQLTFQRDEPEQLELKFNDTKA